MSLAAPGGQQGAAFLPERLAAYRRAAREQVERALAAGPGGSGYGRLLQGILAGRLPDENVAPSVDDLPALVCHACEHDPEEVAPLAAAWWLVRLAAKLFDDVEDGDTAEDKAQALNAGTGFIFLAQLLAVGPAGAQTGGELSHLVAHELATACLQACAGQHADLSSGSPLQASDPDAWLQVAAAKSGALLGWAAWAGAVVGQAAPPAQEAFRQFGVRLGVLLQVADDYTEIWARNPVRAPTGGSATSAPPATASLAVSYALSVADPASRKRLALLLEQARHGDASAWAQGRKLLVELGAQAYLLVVARLERDRALAALQEAGCCGPAAAPLAGLADSLFPALTLMQG